MAKKKTTQISVSQEENAQAQQVLEHYHQIANSLHESKDQQQTETALAEINNMPEGAQIALLKELAKENHVDAADLLTALHELSPLKSVRKEARRSLIRLESARIYPAWQPPIEHTPVISAIQLTTNPPRFWKGVVTGTRASGEVQLLLCWEQGDDYKDVRILGFLLEFWHDGVKDFFTSVQSKRGFDKLEAEMAASAPDVPTKNCSLTQGHRLLLDALATNEKYGTQPAKDYRLHLSLIKQLILDTPLAEKEDESEQNIDLQDLDPEDVVVTFVESWVDGDYDIAYDLLSKDSPLREGLSRDEWIERRDAWADQANPGNLKPNFIHERQPQKPKIWLPNPFSAGRSVTSTQKEVETSWSIALDEIPSNNALPELPQPTAIYEETGQHWFWVTYNLVQENGNWRIQHITDEAAKAQTLSIEELQKTIEGLDSTLEKIAKKHTRDEIMHLKDEDAHRYFVEVVISIIRASSYTDALIKKLPLDPSIYEDAAGRMLTFGQYERCLVYLTPRTQQFPEQRALFFRRIAEVQQRLSDQYFDAEDDERAERYLKLAEKSLHESLAVENSFEAHISLAELLIGEDERLDEAEDHLLQAKTLMTGPEEEAHVELHLGEIATKREEYKQALSHYQRIVDLQPDLADGRMDLGTAHEELGNIEEAEASYKHAIELAPDNEEYYLALAAFYTKNDQRPKAIDLLEDGIDTIPDSTELPAYLAGLYIESGDYHLAEIFLGMAERIDPEAESVRLCRQILTLSKLSQPKHTHTTNKLDQPSKRKKRRR